MDYLGDQVRKILMDPNQTPQVKRAMGETYGFVRQNGEPIPGQEEQYKRSLGDYLTQRGHTVNYT